MRGKIINFNGAFSEEGSRMKGKSFRTLYFVVFFFLRSLRLYFIGEIKYWRKIEKKFSFSMDSLTTDFSIREHWWKAMAIKGSN